MPLVGRVQTILKKKALHHTSIVAAGSLINGASLFALNVVLTRSLSQDLFGIFSLSVIALSTVAEMSDFGLNLGLLRFAPYYIATQQTDKLKQLIKTIWNWRVNLAGILTILGITLAYPVAKYIFGQTEVTPYIAYSFLGIGGVILIGFVATYLQSSQQFFRQASVQALKGILRLLTVVVLAFFSVKNLYAYLSAYIFVPWLLFAVNYGVLPERFRQVTIDKEIKDKLHAQLARFSLWLTVSSLLTIGVGKLEQVMISHYLGLAEVATYTVAWQLVQAMPVVYGSINSVLMPKVSGLASKTELVAFVRRISKWILFGTIGIAVLIFPSQYLITLLFGQKYSPAIPVYLVLAYSLLFNVISIPFSLAITAFNRTHIMALAGIFQLILFTGSNYLLIPRFGIQGAAIAFAISNCTQFFWNVGWATYLVKNKDFIIH